jgi:hypothetical protein
MKIKSTYLDALAEEAERWRADYQQLQRENERLKQQATQQATQAGLERLQTVERSTRFVTSRNLAVSTKLHITVKDVKSVAITSSLMPRSQL